MLPSMIILRSVRTCITLRRQSLAEVQGLFADHASQLPLQVPLLSLRKSPRQTQAQVQTTFAPYRRPLALSKVEAHGMLNHEA